MPLYVHEVEAQVVPDAAPGAPPPSSLTPQDFQAIVSAVLQELDRRQKQARTLQSEAGITGQNQPPSLGT
jgi:hypothetical protein